MVRWWEGEAVISVCQEGGACAVMGEGSSSGARRLRAGEHAPTGRHSHIIWLRGGQRVDQTTFKHKLGFFSHTHTHTHAHTSEQVLKVSE